ncbi:aminotransferase class I/II-fold pyridoxal phosphate-dependent enzyme [Spirosoma sp. HMF4905]|uniref:Aminotransferase class I/II-fold pyridoxal phosphate-dependent enzyme n=1 Tax=Spirosoma arboris TaxID=2682092 RepID=A0A7K1SB59_9BACT|nr:aminotransferase class I/II-fold pyridoxal phosphate-dependent enzyme [Spirosoma arboris]MVM31010.1 aminotransferase class I/II-fold pyridoxal phosphate-dependent enzyme [Spirosoma arboris]
MSEKAKDRADVRQKGENFVISHLPNRTIVHEEKVYRFFSGTAYLGLPQHLSFQHLMADAIGRYGTVFGSSRNGNVRLGIYEVAEAKMADATGAESALTVSSGMMAGQVVINWLRGQKGTFVYAPAAHPALWHEPVVALPSISFADWTNQLSRQLQTVASGPVFILANALNAVRSDYYDFDWVNDLPDDRPITLVVDDSHGLGVLNQGRGIWPQISHKSNVQLIVTASLAKAMGMPGGVIFGEATTLTNLRRTAFFGACSPMPPANLDVYLQADALYAEGYERLQQNILLAEKLLLPTSLFRHATGYPVFFTEHDELYKHLLENEILIYSFAYPTANDRANTRIVISAFHTSEDIQELADSVNEFQRRGRKG